MGANARRRGKRSRQWTVHELDVDHRELGFRSQEGLSDFLYQMKEVADCCADLQTSVVEVWRGLRAAHADPIRLYKGAFFTISDMEHLRMHVNNATRVLRRLVERAEQRPPLCDMSGSAIHSLLFREIEEKLLASWKRRQEKLGGAVIKKRTGRQTASRKRKR